MKHYDNFVLQQFVVFFVPLLFSSSMCHLHVKEYKEGRFIFHGSQFLRENLTSGIPSEICSSATLIELKYVDFDPDVLVNSLKNCDKLESLHLLRINDNKVKFTKRVTLPRLKKFTIDVPYTPNDTTEEKFKSVIFFDKANYSSWGFENIHKLGVDITYSQFYESESDPDARYYFNTFRIDHGEGLLESRLLFIGKLLENLNENDFTVQKLSISTYLKYYSENRTELEFNPKWVQSFERSVKKMELGRVVMTGGGYSEVLKNMDKLEQLYLYSIPNKLDIFVLPTNSLRKLTIEELFDEVEVTKVVKFDRLTTLKFLHSVIPNTLVMNYADMFPKVKYVDILIDNTNEGCFDLLRGILKTCALKIKLFNFDYGKHCPIYWVGKEKKWEDPEMVEFLAKAGIPKCEPSLLLAKNKTTGEWHKVAYSKEFYASFKAGIDVPDTIEGEGEFDDCGLILPQPPKQTTARPLTSTTVPSTTTTITTGTAATANNRCLTEGLHPDPEICNKFHWCTHGSDMKTYTKFEFDCGIGTVYDINHQVCFHQNDLTVVTQSGCM